MARYILNSDTALRTWSDFPYACYRGGAPLPYALSRSDFLALLRCDGTQELAPSPRLQNLEARGYIHVAAPGESLSRWQRYRAFPNVFFNGLSLEITERCNYRCRHCFNIADSSTLQQELRLDEIEAYLEDACECGVKNVTLTGGEPLLHPDFLEIVRLIVKKGLCFHALNTNGARITDELLDQISALGCTPLIKISFDGFGFHDWMRCCEGAEARTLDAIRRCVAKGFRVKVQTNMNRRNMGTIAQTLARLDEMGVWKTRIIRTTEAPQWYAQAGDACLTWSEYFEESLNIVREYSRGDHSMSLHFWMFLTLNLPERSYRCDKVRSSGQKTFADNYLCKNRLEVGANRELYPCLQMSGAMQSNGITMGDLSQQSLRELLHSSDYINIVTSRVQDKISVNEECAACPALKYCCCGCPAISLLMHRRYFGRDESACIFFRNGYYEKISETLPGFTNLTPIPEEIDTDYLKQLNCLETSPGLDGITLAHLQK